MPMTQTIIIFDTEYTTWPQARERGWTGENEYRELVQIGALKVEWPTGKVIAEFNRLVRPVKNPKLSDYFIALTGITQEQVDRDGQLFPRVFDDFMALIGTDTPVYSYGNDVGILAENIVLNHNHSRTLYFGGFGSFINIGYFINRADPATREINSGRLAEHYGLMDAMPAGNEHNALYDCYSILAAMKHLHAAGHSLPF
jgi:inhibitor of KinA sporulation pathway (predicted exonuclease)